MTLIRTTLIPSLFLSSSRPQLGRALQSQCKASSDQSLRCVSSVGQRTPLRKRLTKRKNHLCLVLSQSLGCTRSSSTTLSMESYSTRPFVSLCNIQERGLIHNSCLKVQRRQRLRPSKCFKGMTTSQKFSTMILNSSKQR